MAHGWSRVATSALVGTCLLAGGCAASAKPAARAAVSTPSGVGRVGAVQTYLDAVNKLCDALLPKVMAVTNGGSLDVPLPQYLAQQPAHAKLLADFDRDLARVAVPPEVADKATALTAYIQFANDLDAKRLAAAKQGQAAYAKEIHAEAAAAADPSIAARNAAGFHDSCDAR